MASVDHHGIDRRRLAGGTRAGRSLGAFTLSEPLDAVFLDDRRVRHGVTPIQIIAPDQPAYRDVLVLTFRKKLPAGRTIGIRPV